MGSSGSSYELSKTINATSQTDPDYYSGFPRFDPAAYTGAILAGLIIAVLLVAYRSYFRIRYFRQYAADDICLLLSVLAGAVSAVLANLQRDCLYIWTTAALDALHGNNTPATAKLSDTELAFKILRLADASAVFQWTSIFVTKLSYLLFFRRLHTEIRAIVVWWWTVLAVLVPSGLICMLGSVYICPATSPESFYQMCTGPAVTQRTDIFMKVSTALDILTYLLVITIPVFLLAQALTTFFRKMAFASVLSFTTILIGIVAIRYAFMRLPVGIYDGVWINFWTNIEGSVAPIMVVVTTFQNLYGQQAFRSGSKGTNLSSLTPAPGAAHLPEETTRAGYLHAALPYDPAAQLDSRRMSAFLTLGGSTKSGSEFRFNTSEPLSPISPASPLKAPESPRSPKYPGWRTRGGRLDPEFEFVAPPLHSQPSYSSSGAALTSTDDLESPSIAAMARKFPALSAHPVTVVRPCSSPSIASETGRRFSTMMEEDEEEKDEVGTVADVPRCACASCARTSVINNISNDDSESTVPDVCSRGSSDGDSVSITYRQPTVGPTIFDAVQLVPTALAIAPFIPAGGTRNEAAPPAVSLTNFSAPRHNHNHGHGHTQSPHRTFGASNSGGDGSSVSSVVVPPVPGCVKRPSLFLNSGGRSKEETSLERERRVSYEKRAIEWTQNSRLPGSKELLSSCARCGGLCPELKCSSPPSASTAVVAVAAAAAAAAAGSVRTSALTDANPPLNGDGGEMLREWELGIAK